MYSACYQKKREIDDYIQTVGRRCIIRRGEKIDREVDDIKLIKQEMTEIDRSIDRQRERENQTQSERRKEDIQIENR